MTTSYAQHVLPDTRQMASSLPHLRLLVSAPAQGQEARQVRDNVRAISLNTAARGHSAESAKLNATVRELAESIEALTAMLQNTDDIAYRHVPSKPAFTVQATYRRIGKLKPRHFSLAEQG